jgi:hypothetical protein
MLGFRFVNKSEKWVLRIISDESFENDLQN